MNTYEHLTKRTRNSKKATKAVLGGPKAIQVVLGGLKETNPILAKVAFGWLGGHGRLLDPRAGLSTRIFQAAPTMSRSSFADNFPKPWRLKRLLPAAKRLLGVGGAALLKALACIANAWWH
jgi:hypothetical protein